MYARPAVVLFSVFGALQLPGRQLDLSLDPGGPEYKVEDIGRAPDKGVLVYSVDRLGALLRLVNPLGLHLTLGLSFSNGSLSL